MDNETIEQVPKSNGISLTHSKRRVTQLDGVVIGVLMGFSEKGLPLVAFPGNQSDICISAHSTTVFNSNDIGCQIALLFEGGNPKRPIVIGRMHKPKEIVQSIQQKISVEVDNDRLEFEAENEIVLRCGKASITLTKSGKIILRGNYLLSRSSGVNRIKGGSVQIN